MTDPRRVQPTVALVYDETCPNVDECRTALRAALSAVGASPVWNEWDRGTGDSGLTIAKGRDVIRKLTCKGNEIGDWSIDVNKAKFKNAGVPEPDGSAEAPWR